MTNAPNIVQASAKPVRSAGRMPRKANKVKAGAGLVRINFLLDADLVRRVDRFAEQMAAEDEYQRPASRTDALRALLIKGLGTVEK